jgi:hypothetical protein
MVEGTFLRISRAGYIDRLMCLQMAPEFAFRVAPDHTYLEIPLWKIINGDDEIVEKASRNQQVELVSAASVKLQLGAKLLVQPNPKLHKYGMISDLSLVVEGERQILSTPIILRKDLKWDQEDWLLRVYLMR